MKNVRRLRRNDFIARAKNAALTESWAPMLRFLEGARAAYPISEIQLWALKQIIGPYKFDELNLARFGLVR